MPSLHVFATGLPFAPSLAADRKAMLQTPITPRKPYGIHQLAHAAGAFLHLPWHCCDGLVVVGHAGHLGARPDRSHGETGMRFLLAVPRRPDAARSELDRQSGADR